MILKDRLRLLAARISRLFFRVTSPPLSIPIHQPIIVIAPHPDDETLGCGSFISQRRQQGGSVHLVVLTNGEASHNGHPAHTPDDISTRRQSECLQAADALGIDPADIHFLHLPDGRLPQLADAQFLHAREKLEQIHQFAGRPPVWMVTSLGDDSSEHQAAYRLMDDIRRRLDPPPQLMGYFVWAWRRPWRLLIRVLTGTISLQQHPRTGYAFKSRALQNYASQIRPLPPWPHPVLDETMMRLLDTTEEFFSVPSDSAHTASSKPWERLAYRLYGQYWGAGKPVACEHLDHEYASGAWDHFYGPDERPRFDALVNLIAARGSGQSLLELGCGSGRLLSMLPADSLSRYLGVDLSQEGLRQARKHPHPKADFLLANFETWRPLQSWDLILFNESIGYAHRPDATAAAFASHLRPHGRLIISHFRYGNALLQWNQIEKVLNVEQAFTVSNSKGQTWDIKILKPRT